MDGIIIINKPKDCTSHDVVYKIKKIFNKKVGHTGTLDPLATGVLPILVGKGTECSKYLINHNKIYKAEIQLGKKTKTGDKEGEIIEEQQVPEKILEKENIEKIIKSFLGKQQQIPPIYSAIKVNGKKLYEYARKGQEVEIKPRQIEIYDIKLIKINKKEDKIQFEVKCSKGTYIRSLCEDIAKRLGTIGHMSELERIEVGEFNIENSITLKELDKNREDFKYINSKFITIEKFFENKDKISLDKRKLKLFLNGVRLTYKLKDGVYKIYDNNVFIGTGIIKNNLLKRDIIVI